MQSFRLHWPRLLTFTLPVDSLYALVLMSLSQFCCIVANPSSWQRLPYCSLRSSLLTALSCLRRNPLQLNGPSAPLPAASVLLRQSSFLEDDCRDIFA